MIMVLLIKLRVFFGEREVFLINYCIKGFEFSKKFLKD